MKEFDLDRVIYQFNDRYLFTIRQAFEGVQIFGGIGSGKTSGSGAALARSFLRAGFGGLVLCAKNDEVDTWRTYAKETGRQDDLVIFDSSGDWVFPFLHYEMTRPGKGAGFTENVVRLFMTVHEALSRRSGGGGDPYWTGAMQQLIRNAVDLSIVATGTVSVPLMYDIIRTAPQSLEEKADPAWQDESICCQLLLQGNQKNLDKWAQFDFDAAASFWLREFPSISSKTRSGIISMFTTTADCFMRRPFRQLFSEVPENLDQICYPEFSQEGVIIIMNLPVKEFGDAGRAAQVVYKYMWQQATERRNIKEHPRPVFAWVDEAQNFITDYDMHFQATARSSRACTVYLTQNKPNYYAELGGEGSRARVDSLVGNLQTKIFHANSDPDTNTYAAEVIGKSWQTRKGDSMNYGGESLSMGSNRSESFDYDCPPQLFTRLPKGGPENNNTVGGIVFQNGRTWGGNETFLFATFKQQ